MRAIVIGAGIGGLASAVALERAGLNVTVLERDEPGARTGSGIAMGPNALASLGKLGAAEHVLAAGNTAAGRVILTWRGEELTSGPWRGGIVRRADLYEALSSRLRAQIGFGRRVTEVEERGDAVHVHTQDGGEEAADVVVAADGLRSQTRARLFDASPPIYRGTSWRGIARFEHAFMADRITESWGRGRRIGLQNLGRGWTYWWSAKNAPERDYIPRGERKARLLELFRGWHDPVEQVLEATDEDEILQTDMYDRDPIPRWTTARVALLGDAAHPMTPDLGQGAAQAIEDTIAIGECFDAYDDVPRALREYEEWRREPAYAVMRRARRHYRITHLENPVACWLRDKSVRYLPAGLQLAVGVRRPAWGRQA